MVDKSDLSDNKQLLLSRKQAARALGNVSVSTVKRLEEMGRLRGVRLTKARGAVFFRVADVLAFVEEASVEEGGRP